MAEVIRELISEEFVDKKIRELGAQISKDYAGESVHLVCILKGACFFMCDLAKRIKVPVSMDFMTVSSYGSGTKSSGIVRIRKDLDDPIEGLNVLIVEDIVDSGRTLNYLCEVFKERGCKSVKTCTLLDKPERRVVDLDVDYVGFRIPNEFVVGYGMDFDQKYRDLPFIGIVEFTDLFGQGGDGHGGEGSQHFRVVLFRSDGVGAVDDGLLSSSLMPALISASFVSSSASCFSFRPASG